MRDPMRRFAEHIERHLRAVAGLRRDLGAVLASADLIAAALGRGRRILLCGGGVSSTDARHIAADLASCLPRERLVFRVLVLGADLAPVTGADREPAGEGIFARQIEAFARSGDAVIAIAVGADCQEIVEAVTAAARCGCRTVGLLGGDSGALAGRVERAVVVEADDTAAIRQCHLLVGQLWSARVGSRLAADAVAPSAPNLDSAIDICDEAEAVARVRAARAAGLRVVMTNGCFDILHPGHIAYLEQARGLGDRLLVAVNDDASVGRLKGADRPVNPLSHRLRMLAALGCVDWVVPFAEDTPERLICALLPDVLVKGGDYRPDQIVGADCVRRAGGEVRVLGFVDGFSTTGLIERIRA